MARVVATLVMVLRVKALPYTSTTNLVSTPTVRILMVVLKTYSTSSVGTAVSLIVHGGESRQGAEKPKRWPCPMCAGAQDKTTIAT